MRNACKYLFGIYMKNVACVLRVRWFLEQIGFDFFYFRNNKNAHAAFQHVNICRFVDVIG